MVSNNLIVQIKDIFKSRDLDRYEELKSLAQQLLNYLIELKKKYNIYTSVNTNIVLHIMERFTREKEIYFYSLKDSFLKAGYVCSSASKLLLNYKPEIDSKVTQIMDQYYVLTGITNCDEFACGSYGTNVSGYNAVVLDDDMAIGGSSSGASLDCFFGISDINIGTDTGGSCRFPANLVGCFGFKTSYGTISRFGLISYAHSLDTVGFIVRDVSELDKALKHLFVYDIHDSCMVKIFYKPYEYSCKIKVIIIDYHKMGKEQQNYINAISCDNRFEIEYLSTHCVNTEMLTVVYEIISSIEFFSSLNRYDSIKHSNLDSVQNLDSVYENRYDSFSNNTVEKIIQGAMFLCNKEFRSYYYKALRKRSDILYAFMKLFNDIQQNSKSDVVVITPNVDNTSLYAYEGYQFIANMSGICCLSIPMCSNNKQVSRKDYSSLLIHCAHGYDNLAVFFGKETIKYA